jgi:predicted CXXCH cytochrome family protein
MQEITHPSSRRAGPLFGAMLVLVALALAFTPAVPPVAGATDPTPAPSLDPTPTPAPDPTTPSPDPTTTPVPDQSAAPLPSVDPSPEPSASPSPSPGPTPTPSPSPSPVADLGASPTPSVDPSAEPSASPSPTPTTEVRGTLSLTAVAPVEGRRRIDPGAPLTVRLAATILDAAKGVRMVAAIPPGWAATSSGSGAIDAAGDAVTWAIGDVPAGARPTATLVLQAPLRSPADRPAWDVVLGARLEHADGILDTASAEVLVAQATIIDHVTFALVDDASQVPTYLPPDVPLGSVGQLQLFRVRFQVRNADLLPSTLTPTLQYRAAGGAEFAEVPNVGPVPGQPFYLGAEWRPVAGGPGTLPGPAAESISIPDLREQDRDDATQQPADGTRLMQSSVARAITLDGDSFTEIEYTVRSSLDLPFSSGFELRLADGDRAIPGSVTAVVRSGSEPPIVLSPGQRSGIAADPAASSVPSTPSGAASVDFPLVPPGVIAASWANPGGLPIYRLAVAIPADPSGQATLNDRVGSPHAPDASLVSDTCAICHRAHVSQGPALVTTPDSQSTLCFTCHSGTGSTLNTKAQYTVPSNDATTGSYYTHEALIPPASPNTHALASTNEFGGVSNRHSVCADCHNAHNATDALSTQTTGPGDATTGTGWTVAGANVAVSGVSVDATAGTTLSYTFLDGAAGAQPTLEYQVCFKCHSGFTTLNTNDPLHPSRDALDKAIELDPKTASFHPIEAPGTNTTAAMDLSLAGTSPYKLWVFTAGDTVRCVNCHANPASWTGTLQPNGTTAAIAAGGDLAPHASQYRGILIQNYRDRTLKGLSDAYNPAEFALCYVCHAEQPFTNTPSAATNFPYHELHVSAVVHKGANLSTDIDAPGAGAGNAICAECHFRIHGTALAYQLKDGTTDVGDPAKNTRLINFAPDVLPYKGVLKWTPTGGGGGTCTLTCHGKDHDATPYGP